MSGSLERIFDNPRGELYDSSLLRRALDILDSLPLERIKSGGIWRDRGYYFLNIAYPSMQAMKSIDAEAVHTSSRRHGRRIALYVHIPFCTAECYYCHYYKRFAQSSTQVDAYIDTVERELAKYHHLLGTLEAESVYVGGGTPSYMSPSQIDRLFRAIKTSVDVLPQAEISFEVHPESGSKDRLEILASHGVNRINIGVESFDDAVLSSENRRHTAAEAIEVYHRVEAARFANINLDLIYGLKGQTLGTWESNLDQLASILPPSATLYYLRLKRGTPEHKLWKSHPETFPSDFALLAMHAMNFERMEHDLGYLQDPVDWYIRNPVHFHRYQDHNWRKTDETELLGVGASAYSYLNGWQYYNVNDTTRYQAAIDRDELPVWKGEFLTGEERMRRTLMLGLKMGIDRASFRRTYGTDVIEAFASTFDLLFGLGLVDIRSDAVTLTYSGRLFADEVGQQFYSDSMKRRMAEVDPELVSTTWPQFNP